MAMEMVIETVVDKMGLKKQLNDVVDMLDEGVSDSLKNSASKMGEEAKKQVESGQETGKSASGGGGGVREMLGDVGGKVGGIAKSIGFVSGLIAKIGAGIFTIVSVTRAFKQPLMMINNISKMVSQFLQPISDTVMMMIAPVFSMLRPLVQTFQTLMQPFREAAMRGISAAQELIGRGTKMGLRGEEGANELIKEGLRGAVSSASLMLSGFLDVITKPLQNIEFAGIGESIKNGITMMQEMSQEGVLRVTMFRDTFKEFEHTLGDTSEAANIASQTIDSQMDMLRESVDDFTIDSFEENVKTANKISEGHGELLKGNVEKVDEILKGIDTSSSDVLTNFSLIESKSKTFKDNINNALDSLSEERRKQQAISVGDEITQRSQDEAPGWFARFANAFSAGSGRAVSTDNNLPGRTGGTSMIADLIIGFSDNWETEQEAIMRINSESLNTIKQNHDESFADMVQTQIQSNMKMEKEMNESFGAEEGRIPKTVESGTDKMSVSAKRFADEAQNTSRVIDDAVRSMENYARKYRRAKEEIRRQERRIDSRRAI